MKGSSYLRLVVLVTSILYSCSNQNMDNSDIDAKFIQFSHNEQDVVFNPKDITNNGDEKKMLLFNQELYMQDISLTTTFEVLTNEPLIISTGKTLGYIRIENNIISIYKSTNYYNSTELNERFDLLSPLQKGIYYNIGFHKTIAGITFFIKGGSISFEKNYDIDEDFLQNLMHGKPYFEVESGSVRVHKSILSADYNQNPRVSVIGDSFVEGIALYQNQLSLNHRWCDKLAHEIGVQDCVIEGKGGERISKEWFGRFKLINSWFKSKYVIISMGTNNHNSIGDYKKYIKQAIDHIKNNNQIPILVTITPRPNAIYDLTAKEINNWVKSCGHVYIDIHKAVTKDNDASEWKDGYVLPDGTHPTVLGYDAMFEQVKLDCPFLFIN